MSGTFMSGTMPFGESFFRKKSHGDRSGGEFQVDGRRWRRRWLPVVLVVMVSGGEPGWGQQPPPSPGAAPPAGTQAPPSPPSAPSPGGPAPVPAPGGGGQNPFFDTAPTQPAQTAKPRATWPSLRKRLSKTRADHIGKTYLCQEAAYIGYYEMGGVPVAGFRVPERRQMVYLRVGDTFWNGRVTAITPRQVEVIYREEPESKPRVRQMERLAYGKGNVMAMGSDELPAGTDGPGGAGATMGSGAAGSVPPVPSGPAPSGGVGPVMGETPGMSGPAPASPPKKNQ